MQIYLDSRPEFQNAVDDILDRIKKIRAADKETFLHMRGNKTRLAAAALTLANQTPSQKLYDLLKTVQLPTGRIKDDRTQTVKNICIHMTPGLMDHVKAGVARLNIEILGELEDSSDVTSGDETPAHQRRINERQYMHLIILYLLTVSEDTLYLVLTGSSVLHRYRDVIAAENKEANSRKNEPATTGSRLKSVKPPNQVSNG